MQIPRKNFWRDKGRATSSLQAWWIQFFLWRVTVKPLFWRGQITSPYFLRGTDQNNELAPLEKSDFFDFENGHFCGLKRLFLIYNSIQYYIWPYFQEQLINKIVFCLPRSWVNSFGKINFWDFETSFNILFWPESVLFNTKTL